MEDVRIPLPASPTKFLDQLRVFMDFPDFTRHFQASEKTPLRI